MRYAIDRYAVGHETEVCSVDFENQYFIPGRRNRFYCPECGEIVYFRDRGGSHPSQFYHQEKTERTPECDRRVDGRSELSLSQRVGLPLFLTGIVKNRFQLSVGFPALGSDMLEKATAAGCNVEISSGDRFRSVKVDQTNFFSNSITLVPVDFVPPNGKNYVITASGSRSVFGLQRKWSDYADGFERDGAVFTYDETGGRKIRRGDSISTNRSYYLAVRNKLPQYPQIHQEFIGTLDVGKDSFSILKIEIMATTDDQGIFSAISTYLNQHFGVWLLECQPELIPVWPPVIQQDYFIPVKPEVPVLCAVSSGNAVPNVYTYTEYSVQRKEIKNDFRTVNMVEVSVGKRPVMLSVDRKYVGREITFYYKELRERGYDYSVEVFNSAGDSVCWDSIDALLLSKDFVLATNSKMELYLGCKDRTFRNISLREGMTAIPARNNTSDLYLMVGSGIVRHIRCTDACSAEINEEELGRLLKMSCKGRMVPVPRWAEYMIRNFKKNHDENLYRAARCTIIDGSIYLEALKQLRLYTLDNAVQTDRIRRNALW